ncbi:MAG: acetyl-CoA carboxylase biotin carboxylase subunit, partial [candidate division Zixibacteria bacterium]|nr:acetyl-CoA carboxylase biotin carboxylase subunit [candidate division Zixibacteria bacterium]
PVTELITGIDLVKEQVKVARGEKLGFSQKDVRLRGHAIECRIYAEDPNANFVPSTGTLRSYNEPGGIGVRVDSGVTYKAEIPIYYDPMISKLCAWGADRSEAVRRMRRALSEYRISGVATTVNFHLSVMDNEAFQRGNLHTHFIDEEFPEKNFKGEGDADHILQAAAISACLYDFLENSKIKTTLDQPRAGHSNWTRQGRKAGVNRVPE